MSIVFISGSPSARSRSALLLSLVRERIAARGEVTRWVALRDLPAEALLGARVDDIDIAAAITEVESARAVVLSSPIYKAAYSGLLKAFLDLLPQKALEGKLILPLSSAGSPLHVLALDFTIRPVLAALGAREVISPVSALDSQIVQDDATGAVELDPLIAHRTDDAIGLLLERLHSQHHDSLRARQSAPISFSTVQVSV